ncbi:MAG: cardiolipin synthase [Phycisphaerae bacterium]
MIWAFIAHGLLALFVIAVVLRRRKEPMSMLAWIFAIVTLPFMGSVLYGLLDSTRVRRKASRRRRRVAHLMARLKERTAGRAHGRENDFALELPKDLRAVEQIGSRLVQMPATSGNAVRIYQEANETYAALEQAIRTARRHIHLEYYIWQPDQTGRHFRDLLAQKARQGVECRLLLDAVGCWRLTRRFTRPLTEAGCQVAFFMPLYPSRRRFSLHLRNHRRIAVIDGRVAFLGSQNIGDEYRGRLKRLSPWYDSHMRVSGPAALFLQQTFAEDWVFATRRSLTEEAYFPAPECAGDSVVQVLPTGPEQDFSSLGQLVFAAVSTANSSIRIATPYFVPSAALRMALIHACYRGVRVQLVLPTRSDAPLVLWAGRSFYPELLDAGVEIYEFDAGMLHSKIVTVDERWCMLGTANMDVRSFRLNFEVTALLYDRCVTQELSASIERHCRNARRIRPREVWQRRLPSQLLEGVARLFAPLL